MKVKTDKNFVYVLVENGDYLNGDFAELYKLKPRLIKGSMYQLPLTKLKKVEDIPYRPFTRLEVLNCERELSDFLKQFDKS